MAASNATLDPLQALAAALAVPADSSEQATLLESLRDALENQQNRIPILCTTLVKTIAGAGDSLLKRWVLDLVHFGLARSTLPLEIRTQLAGQSLDTLAGLLDDLNPATVKIVIECFATIYPLLFRLYCTNRNLRSQWETLAQCKARIIELAWSLSAHSGIRIVALKFVQRVVLVQTRGVSDPRLQNKADPNLTLCASDHPFLSSTQLESEGTALLERLIALLFQSGDPSILSALLHSWGSLARLRPALLPLLVSALATWTPREIAGLSASRVRSVEKTLRILLLHISRGPQGTQYAHQIQDALQQQALRIEQAERLRRDAADMSRKRPPSSAEDESPGAKRAKLAHPSEGAAAGADAIAGVLASFDFSALPVGLVADLVVANLRAISEQALTSAIEAYRESQAKHAPAAPKVTVASTSAAAPPVSVKQEPVDPLQMDIDEDDIEYEPDRLNDQFGDFEPSASAGSAADAPPLALIDFKLPPPKPLSEDARTVAVRSAVGRIQEGAQALAPSTAQILATNVGLPATDMWMLLLVRMITRGQAEGATETGGDVKVGMEEAEDGASDEERRNDDLRRTLCDYVLDNFSARVRLATVWMNEEWYNDRIRAKQHSGWRPRYDTWLHKLVSAHQEQLDAKDRTFSQFLLDLPALPDEILSLLREFCTDTERTQVGFLTLREFVTLRPPLRAQALDILLELTTHPAKTIRTPAINTVKRWVPDVQPMDSAVRNFSLRLLRRLQRRTPDMKPDQTEAPEEGMEDGQLPQEEVLQTMYLPEAVTLPADKAEVLQHVELLFALSVRVPDLLDEIFAAYGQMDVSVQQAIQDLITALVRSLGPTHGKLLTLLRTFPPGAETLALRVLTIFTENGRPHATIVVLVKALIAERDLDARFLIPIIAEMDKADILRHLPRIVSMLNGQAEPKNLVRSVFGAIVTTPPQTFGSVTSNLPRVRQSELLTPAELMVLLHESEKEIGLNSAKEAISICFSMTDVFRSEILAVVMQQIMDEPVIPLLFMRTVIQSVQTYKSLVGFVSTTLLSRLITKKIWTNHALWQGFIHCAKAIAPASFGALLQLPKDQLRELVDKQPGLKSGLREYVIKKAGNKARVASFLEVFGEGGGTPPQTVNVSPPPA